jgi:hypothetical protein
MVDAAALVDRIIQACELGMHASIMAVDIAQFFPSIQYM